MKVRPGDAIRIRESVIIEGDAVAVPDPYRLTHLQFRRFAGCPICSVHLQSMVARHGEITAAGIHEVVVFHSTPHELRSYAGDLPLDVVADPDKQLYMKFGVDAAPRAVLDPRALAPVLGRWSRVPRARDLRPGCRPVPPAGASGFRRTS